MNGDERSKSTPTSPRRRFSHPLLSLTLTGALVLGCAVAALRQHADMAGQDSPSTTRPFENIPGLLRFELVRENSHVHLRGTTNISSWNSVSNGTEAAINLPSNLSSINALFDQVQCGAKPDLPVFPVHLTPPSAVQIAIPVESFKGDSAGMDRDMQKALKATEHPDITYVLESVEAIRVMAQQPIQPPAFEVRAHGKLSVAGVQRAITTDAVVSRDSRGHYFVHAEQPLLMSDFGVTPPTALFGLIHAGNSMSVVFDLDFAPDHPPATAPDVQISRNR